MARIARVMIPDIPYHVTQRGNYRMDVFESDEDKQMYLSFFDQYRKEYDLKVYAWVLMDNHVHFVVEPKDVTSVAKVFNNTHMRYSHYFNNKKGVQGHLWQGRFYSCPLEKDHLYEAIRYVELNPIRANLVSNLSDYQFCSSRRLLNDFPLMIDSVDKLLEIDDWEAYLKEEMNEDLVAQIISNSKTGRPSGSKKFITKLEKITGRNLIAKKHGRPKKGK